MQDVLKGDFTSLPRKDSNIVRVFLSSTFGDFIEERDKLSRETFPRLQSYCKSLGLEFQVVDMRWGIRDENISYHQTSDVCIQEIHSCQRLSAGPTFLALIGDRYGYRPFPAQIPLFEFRQLVHLGQLHGIDTTLLSKWYQSDENSLDVIHQLQPITKHFTHYISKDPELRAAGREGWWKEFQQIQKTLWMLVEAAVAGGEMSKQRAHIYLQSVTEDEITHGIFECPSPNSTCLCYTRTMSNLSDSLSSDASTRSYVDTLPSGALDEQAQTMLQDLKFAKIPRTLSTSNVHNFSIPWVPGGVNINNDVHARYLVELCDLVYSDVKRLIDGTARIKKVAMSRLHAEVLHHASLCVSKCECYCDRRDAVMTRVEDYVKGSSNLPLIIHGKSGSGKTSIMAKAALSIREWRGDDSNIALRFLGTSPMSSSIRCVLVSLCLQICGLFGEICPDFHKMDVIEVTRFFRNLLLDSPSKGSSRQLILLLDSIDQLAPTDSAHSMKWLPLELPPNIHIVISILDAEHNCLENMTTILPYSAERYICVGPMHVDTGYAIMDLWLSRIGRRINDTQRAIISNAFLSCSQPLFLKLLFSHAREWKSYTEVKVLTVPTSTQEALSQFYEGLEEQFGKVLVQKALGYLTASKHGLTESELEDALSLDDEVLNDVYQYWDPPVKGVIRVPSLLWKRIHHFIVDYIVEQQADGMTVLMWYHRQFIESATALYVTPRATKLHHTLADLFEGTWGDGRGKSVELLHRGLCLRHANRQVASQPLVFGESMYNARKLNGLPFHLLHSHQVAKLRDVVLCDFVWIHTKLKAVNYSSLMQDYVATLSAHGAEEDISLMCETLSLAGSNLRNDPDTLAGQLLGRLNSAQSKCVQKLLCDADDWINRSKCCTFRPMNNCLIGPGGELRATLSGHPQVVLALTKSPSTSLPLLVSYSKAANKCDDLYQVWNMSTLDCIECINTFRLQGTGGSSNFAVTSDHLIAVCGSSYAVWNLNTGSTAEHSVELDSSTELTCVAVAGKVLCLIFGTHTGRILLKSLSSSSISTCMELDLPIRSIFITSDEKLLLVLAGDERVAVFDMSTRKVIRRLDFGGAKLDAMSMTNSEPGAQTFFLVGSDNGVMHIFGLPNLDVRSFKAHTKAIKSIVHVSSLSLIVTGSLDRLVHVWDLNTLSHIQTLKGHADGVWCLSSIPGTKFVVSGSKDDYLKVWDVLSGECLHTLEGHSSWISCVAAVTDDVVISGSNDKTLKIWHLRERSSMSRTKQDRHNAHPECILLRDTTLAVSCAPDAIKVWDPLSGKCVHTMDSSASCLAILDGSTIVSGSKEGTLKVWSLTVSHQLSLLKTIDEGHSNKITGLIYSNDQSVLVSSSLDSTLKIWNTNFDVSQLLVGHTGGVICTALSCDTIASGSQDANVRIWSLSTPKCMATLEGHTKAVDCIAFSSGRDRLISGSDDNSARVWSLSDYSCLAVISFTDSVKCVCSFDADSIFITGAHCSKNQLKSWTTGTGAPVRNFVAHSHAVMCMRLVGHSHMVTGSRDGTVRIWNVVTAEMLGSFDLQSQVKHISVSRLRQGQFLLAATTKSGPIAFLRFDLP